MVPLRCRVVATGTRVLVLPRGVDAIADASGWRGAFDVALYEDVQAVRVLCDPPTVTWCSPFRDGRVRMVTTASTVRKGHSAKVTTHTSNHLGCPKRPGLLVPQRCPLQRGLRAR